MPAQPRLWLSPPSFPVETISTLSWCGCNSGRSPLPRPGCTIHAAVQGEHPLGCSPCRAKVTLTLASSPGSFGCGSSDGGLCMSAGGAFALQGAARCGAAGVVTTVSVEPVASPPQAQSSRVHAHHTWLLRAVPHSCSCAIRTSFFSPERLASGCGLLVPALRRFLPHHHGALPSLASSPVPSCL